MDKSNDDRSFMAIGGLLAAGVLGMVAIKAANQFMIELEIAFSNFGTMIGSFIPMLWNLLLVLFLIVSLIAAVASASYFIFRYYRMVNALLAAKEGLSVLTQNLHADLVRYDLNIQNQLADRFEKFDDRIFEIDRKLTEALVKEEQPVEQLPADTHVTESISVSNSY